MGEIRLCMINVTYRFRKQELWIEAKQVVKFHTAARCRAEVNRRSLADAIGGLEDDSGDNAR
jgi:hypothetical protein